MAVTPTTTEQLVNDANGGASSSPIAGRTNPFVGLRPFNTDESLFFFGRRQQTVELLERLHQTHFIAVVGSSGCGKSSLIRAGLIPKLLAGFLVETRDAWRIATLKPGDAPLRNLAAALCETNDPAAIGKLQTAIQEGGAQAIFAHLQQSLIAANANLLLLVDQFEELFRFGIESGKPEHHDEAADFVALLLQLAEQRQLPVYVVLTMRSDFLGDCDNFHGLPEALNRSQYLVPRLTREQRRQAIEGPVRLFGAEIAPRLLDRLLNDVGDQSDQLPVLQHALMRTWEWWEFDQPKRRRDIKARDNEFAQPCFLPLDLPQYLEAGTIKDALAYDAEEALNGLSDDELKLTGQMFRALTATDSNNRKIRRPAHLSELCAITKARKGQLQKIIERLRGNHRSFLLLTGGPDPLVDISHESLIRQWPRVEEWMKQEQEAGDVLKRLVEAARRKRELWRGSDLAEAQKWRADNWPNAAWAARYDDDPLATAKAFDFLDRSQVAEAQALAAEVAQGQREAEIKHRELRRTRAFAAAIGVALLCSLGLAWYAWQKQQAARQQEQIAKTQGRRARQLYYDASMNAAQEAYERGNRVRVYELLSAFLPSPETDELSQTREFFWYHLWQVWHALGERRTLRGHTGAVNSVAFAPDGKTLASASSDGTVKLWDVASDQVKQTLRGHTGAVNSVAFAPDGKTLASASSDGMVKLWDVASEQVKQTLQGHEGAVNSVAFALDGQTLVSASEDRTVKLWDVVSGQVKQSLSHADKIWSVAFAQEWQMLASANEDKTVKLWYVVRGQVKQTLGHSDKVWAVAFAPDGKMLASASEDQTVKLWDVASGQVKQTLGHAGGVRSVAFAPDGQTIASASEDKTVKLWDVETGQAIATFKDHTGPVYTVAFAPNGKTLASAGGDSNGKKDYAIRLWFAATDADVARQRNWKLE